VHGSATDRGLLTEEGAEGVESFVAVTDDHEENVVACLLARRLGAAHTIALVDNPALAGLIVLWIATGMVASPVRQPDVARYIYSGVALLILVAGAAIGAAPASRRRRSGRCWRGGTRAGSEGCGMRSDGCVGEWEARRRKP